LVLNSSWGVLLAASEDISAGAVPTKAKLVDVNVCSKGDETDEGVVGERRQYLLDRDFACCQFILWYTGVYNEDKGRWGGGSAPGRCVLDCGVLREEFSWDGCLGDALVMRGEMVAVVAEWTGPKLSVEVYHGIGVEDRATRFAGDGFIVDGLELSGLLGGGVKDAERDDALGCF
jgi:hypothetical protein